MLSRLFTIIVLNQLRSKIFVHDSQSRESSNEINIALEKLGVTNMRILNESENYSSSTSNQSHPYILLLITSLVTCMGVFLFLMTPLSVHPLMAQDQQIEKAGPETNQTESTSPQANSSLVDFASNLEQIRGHLQQAVINKESGNNTLAKAHTLHPIDEIYGSIQVQIDASDPTLNQSLFSSLNQLSSSVDNSTIEEFRTKASDVNGLLNDTFDKVIPSQESNSTNFSLMVVADLLTVAETEYGEAVENGTVTEIVEYQDYSEAETLAIQAYLDNYEFIEAPLAEQNQTLMETTELMLREELRQLIQNKASLQEIQDHIDEISMNLDQAEVLLAGGSS